MTLVAFGLLLYYADRKGHQNRSLDQFNWGDCFSIGVSQAVALIPGVSKKRHHHQCGKTKGSSRPASARLSFLLSTPVIVGAGALQGLHLLSGTLIRPRPEFRAGGRRGVSPCSVDVMTVGMVTAAITGFLCIRYFLDCKPTIWCLLMYRIILAAVVLLMYLKS